MKKIFSIMALAIVAFGFSACEDIPSPYEIIEDITDAPEEEVIAPTGDGTAAAPFNVAGIIEYCKSLGADVNSDKEVYFTGIVTRFKDGEEPGNSYGNATFYISDTGSEADEFYCFRCYGPGNKKFTSADQMKVGDKVTLCAKVVNYKGNTPETVQGSAYVALVGDGTIEGGNDGPAADPTGDGTQNNPYNVTAALNFTNALKADTESAPVYVKGIVCDDPDIDTGNYGNATFHISADGNNSNSFYCFRVMDFGGKKFKSANFKKGDEVVIYGPVVNYKGNTPETVANKCNLYSVNGKVQEGGNSDTPAAGEVKGTGTAADPFNVAGVIAYTSKLAADVNSDKEVYFTGIVKKFKSGEEPGNSYGNATFYIMDEGSDADFYCFRVLGKDGKKFTEGAEAPAVGDKVTVRGLVVNYKGNTPETVSGQAYIESIVKGEGGGTETPSEPEVVPGSSENGDFEQWSDASTPLHWKTTSTAGNAVLKQSTDAHSGKYSVEVTGVKDTNKRVGREEMTLEAGEYTMSFWVKAATSTGGSVCPGFVPVNAGKVGSYAYGEYTNNIPSDKWIQVTHTFTLDKTGVYSLVIMNSGKPGGNVLIDDFVLTKGDAKVIGSHKRAAARRK